MVDNVSDLGFLIVNVNKDLGYFLKMVEDLGIELKIVEGLFVNLNVVVDVGLS